MNSPSLLRVRNLHKYQHYKRRNPPWVKLYRETLTDHTIRQLTPSQRFLFLVCVLLASESEDGTIPDDTKYLAFRAGIYVRESMLSALVAHRLLERADSVAILPSPEPVPAVTGTSAPRRRPGADPARTRRVRVLTPLSGPVWEAYVASYLSAYGVPPTRNAKVNAQLKRLVARLGAADAAAVAGWYPSHRAQLYVQAGHCTDLLLRDAEKLRTEWARGRTITTTQARQIDQRETMRTTLDEALRILEVRDGEKNGA